MATVSMNYRCSGIEGHRNIDPMEYCRHRGIYQQQNVDTMKCKQSGIIIDY